MRARADRNRRARGPLLALLLLWPAWAQGAAFLQVEGIPGESRDPRHPEWIDVLGWSESLLNSSAFVGSGQTREATRFQPFRVVKQLDKSSPPLWLACANGQPLARVDLDITATDGTTPLFKIVLRDVIVTSISSDGEPGGEPRPTENVTFNYRRIEWTKFDEVTGGELELRCWDVGTMTDCTPVAP